MELTKQEAIETTGTKNGGAKESVKRGLIEATNAAILLNDEAHDAPIPVRPTKRKGDRAYFVK